MKPISFFLLIVEITKIIIKSLYNMTDNYLQKKNSKFFEKRF